MVSGWAWLALAVNRLEAEVGRSPGVVLADQDQHVRGKRLHVLPARTGRVIDDCRLKRTAAAVARDAFVDRGIKGRPATVREPNDPDPVGLDVGQSAQIGRGVVGVQPTYDRRDGIDALADPALIAWPEAVDDHRGVAPADQATCPGPVVVRMPPQPCMTSTAGKGPFPGGRYSCRGALLFGPPTDFSSYFSGSRSDSRLAQCARMNGNTNASAAFADNVAYRMEPQRRVACRDASTLGRTRCVTWVTQPPAFCRN